VAPVKAEAEFLEVGLRVLREHPALVGAQQPALAQRRDTVHRGQQFVRVVPGPGDRARLVDEPVPARLRVGAPASVTTVEPGSTVLTRNLCSVAAAASSMTLILARP